MAVRSLFSSVSTLATGAVDAPVRAIVEAVLDERGFAGREALDAARGRLEELEAKVAGLLPRVEAAEQRAGNLVGEVQRLQTSVDDLTRDLSDARDQALQAVARADEAETGRSELVAAVEALKAEIKNAASGKVAAGKASTDDRAVVGAGGAVEVRGKTFYVHPQHEGERYSVAHNGAVRVGRRLVKKSAAPLV
jgi:hypothetical protein